MQTNEVVEVLALARVGKGTEGRLYESLEHAIKCVELMPELVDAYEDYIHLLQTELSELVGIASVHGWKSCRYDVGVKARDRIAKAKELIK